MARYNQGGGYNADSNKDKKQGPVDEMPQSPWASANSGGGFTNTSYNSGMPAFGSWQTRGQHNYSTAQRTGMKARGAINKAVGGAVKGAGGVLGWMGKMGKGAYDKARMKYGNAENAEDVLAGKGNIRDLVKNQNGPLEPNENEGVSPYAPDSSENYVEDDRNFIQKAWDNKGYSKKDRAAHADKSQSIMENIQRKNFAAQGMDYDDQQSYDYSAELDRFNEESEMARNNEVYTAGGDKESWDPDMQWDVDTGTSEEDYYMEEVKDRSAAGLLRKLMPGGNKGTKMVERSDGSTEEDFSSMTEEEYAQLNQDYSGDSQTEEDWRQEQIQQMNQSGSSSEIPDIRRGEDEGYSPQQIEGKEMKRNFLQKAMSRIKQKMNDKKVAKWQEGMPDRDFKDDLDANEPYEQGDSSSEYGYDADYSGESSEPFVSEENQPGFEDRDLAAELSQGKITREEYMKLKKKQAHFKYQDVEGIDSEPPSLLNTAMKNSRRA